MRKSVNGTCNIVHCELWIFFTATAAIALRSKIPEIRTCVLGGFFNLMNFIRWAPHVPRYTLWLPTDGW
jgi:hypothetical protein